jgi:hypothetical protein
MMWLVEIIRQEDDAVMIPDIFPLLHRGTDNSVAQQTGSGAKLSFISQSVCCRSCGPLLLKNPEELIKI